MYNLSTREACCYWFDESNGSLEASVFASCIVDQLQIILNRKLLPVILYFYNFSKDLIYKTIRPGRKFGDPTITDLRVLKYKPDGTIWYSLNFDEPLQPLPQRPMKITNVKPLEELPKLFSERLPISQRKYKDLQDLKAVIPSNCHAYYDELPYKN
ncbi:unnamed protein product [Pieris macdunnoughi]|uniref:Uncharacterized protein n=1 Tax=Pieris macdunnoughi TaxID=345717 RepID=A0A821WMW2_9NEOP|nr:unnamed protein product [Pieris macdunnoughi]